MGNVIQVRNVYKQYDTIGTLRVRTILQDALQALRRTQAVNRPTTRLERRFVLQDVNFELGEGQSLGLIGHNGSGKTTLLRLLAGISLPTKGEIRVKGRIAPLLALGAGFHQEMTGYENLFLNCTLMGLSRTQTKDRIEQIIAFADIGEYINVPIKRYSSGMLARLGFATAIHMEPEIILLDEVLAVGDYSFSVKATSAIQEFIRKGTLVFVSHDLASVEKLCERTIWLDHGQVRADGRSSEVITAYTNHQQQLMSAAAPNPALPNIGLLGEMTDGVSVHKQVFDPRVSILQVNILNRKGRTQSQFSFGEDIVIRCHLRLAEAIPRFRLVIGIIDIESRAVITACDNQLLEDRDHWSGDIILEAVFPSMKLRPRQLGVWVGASNPVALLPLATWRDTTPRFFSVGPRQDPEHHYFAPQGDLTYTPGSHMSMIQIGVPEQGQEL
jgi:ABC-type polysaccharide/polyol phosphate transport system ATPase subunit